MAMTKSERSEVERLHRRVVELEALLALASGPPVQLPLNNAPNGMFSNEVSSSDYLHRKLGRSVTAVISGHRIRITAKDGHLDINGDGALAFLPSASNSMQVIPTTRSF